MGWCYEEHVHFRAGRGGKPQKKQKSDIRVVGWRQGEKAQKPKE